MVLAQLIVGSLGAYMAVGLVFSLAFVTVGVGRIDPDAIHGTRGFRLLILPGAAALWPLLAWRWARGLGPPDERNTHRDAAGGAP